MSIRFLPSPRRARHPRPRVTLGVRLALVAPIAALLGHLGATSPHNAIGFAHHAALAYALVFALSYRYLRSRPGGIASW